MKKILLSIAFLFLIGAATLQAQDYRAYVPQRPAYFHSNSGINYWFYEETRGIAEDTSWISGSHRIVKSYQEEIPSTNSFGPCFDLDTTWVGVQIEQDTITGETWFNNYSGDTIKFFPSATVGQSGIICRMQNGNVMRGIVTSVVQAQVMSVNDSVKTIVLNLEDQFGSPLPHAFNGKTVQVGKQHGLIRTYAWNDFPADTSSYTLYGMENPVEGAQIITAADIYDYNIGDRFDWVISMNTSPPQWPTQFYYHSWTITGKTVNGDTIAYNVSEDYVYKIGNTVMNQVWGQTFVWQVILSQQDAQFEFDHRPFDIMQYPDTLNSQGGWQFDYATMPYAPSTVNGRQLKGYVHGPPYFYDTVSHCFNGLTVSFGPCDGYHDVYGEGIGKVYSYAGSASCWTIYQLVYFEKGAETWGTPLNWSVILNTDEIVTASDGIEVWPNPASDVVNINLHAQPGNVDYQIYNIYGQLVSQGNGAANDGILQIPVIQLAEGVYSVVISGKEQRWTSTFVR